VNSSQLNLVEIDTGGTGTVKTVQAGTARAQKTLSASSIQATSVAALTGMTSMSGVPSPNVIIGVFCNSGTVCNYLANFVPASAPPPVVSFDQNNAGSTAGTFLAVAKPAPVQFDPTTGRAVLSGAFFPSAAIYLYDSGSGFIVDVTTAAGGGNNGFSGPLMLQAAMPAPGFTSLALSGNSIGLAGATSSSSLTNLDIAVNFVADTNPKDPPGGNYSGEFDFTLQNPNFSVGTNGQGVNAPWKGPAGPTIYGIDVASLGHGEISQVPSGLFNNFPIQADSMSFFLIGPNQLVAIEDTGLSPCGIMFFDPQNPVPVP
jgi:hypothetical protein